MMEPEVAKLCTFCAGLILLKKETPISRAHHANMGFLERSSQSCSICRVLMGQWSIEKFQKNFPDISKEAYESIFLDVNLKEIQRVGSGLSWAILNTYFHIGDFLYHSSFSITTCNTESIIAGHPIWRAATTSTLDKIFILKSWLDDCELKHHKCRPVVHYMPKRLIDVGSLGGRPPRLVITESLCDHDIRYATLSYCWGNANFCTTRANENLHRQEIPFQLIPRTLQDALILTRYLHIQYLWIDALCIVQDDNAEWQIEASRIQDTYSGSSITIAATDAVDSSAGLFFSAPVRALLEEERCTFLRTGDIEDGFRAIVRVQPNDIRKSSENSVLSTRGWVLQEMVLSRRTVHCMRSGLYWECRSECRTETGLVFDRSVIQHSSVPILPQNLQLGANKTWWKWIENYSGRRFSFAKDRLPALSGIVQHYQTATNDVPILGLWERSFQQDLLWMRMEELPGMVDSNSHNLTNIPSWTWLSCPYKISYDFWNSEHSTDEHSHEIFDYVKLIEWEVVWTFEPLVSEVISTRLILDGPVQENILSVPKGEKHNPTYLYAENEKPGFDKKSFPRRCSGQFDSGPRMSPTRYLCLLLRSKVHKNRSLIRETFLILQPCSGKNVYRRVGIGMFLGQSRSFDLNVRRTLSLV